MSFLEAIQKQFSASQILLPGSKEFQEQNGSYLAAQQSEIIPEAIFQPASEQQVAEFVKIAKVHNATFAVRGGGQNPLPFCANIEKPGITLDLALINNITVKEGYISIGAGARWKAAYEALDGTGFGVSGNRSEKSGIGGLALQGSQSSINPMPC
jgi:FAD/FMN-containing dehydrogenase